MWTITLLLLDFKDKLQTAEEVERDGEFQIMIKQTAHSEMICLIDGGQTTFVLYKFNIKTFLSDNAALFIKSWAEEPKTVLR